jgi:beta-glucoside operon transcriptional antiterminator
MEKDSPISNNSGSRFNELNDILNIIKYHYNTTFDEKSMNYIRLVTHLQYFIYRIHQGDFYHSEGKDLNGQVKLIYPEAYKCVKKIRTFIKGTHNRDLSYGEETYLMLHIHRVTHREERN